MLIRCNISNTATFPCPFQISPFIDRNHNYKVPENLTLIKYQLKLHPENAKEFCYQSTAPQRFLPMCPFCRRAL